MYKERKTWTDAELHCRREGGRLAIIQSQWQQTLAEKASEGAKDRYGMGTWLGGRIMDDRWQWADNTSLSFTNWKSGSPGGDEFLVLTETGQWDDTWSDDNVGRYFLCQGINVALTVNGLTTLELEENQLAFFPLHVLLKTSDIGREMINRSHDEEGRISSLTLNWFLKDSNGTKITEKLPARQEDWKQEVQTPLYKDLLLHDMVKLAMKLRLQNMIKEEILEEVIYQKSQMRIIPDVNQMCEMGQVKPKEHGGVFSAFVSNASTNDSSAEPSSEDIETGYELFHAVVFCPAMVFKVYNFIDKLLANETSQTIIQSIVHLLQSDGVVRDKKSFTLTKQFYHVMASTLDMLYGNILLATTTNVQRESIVRKGLPYFLNHTDLVEKCLQESNCDSPQDIFQNIGNFFIIKSFHLFSSISGANVSRELSLHPVHLTPDKKGNLPPSALVPFCSHQGEQLGSQLLEMNNMTFCDKFQPTILEGQLCYTLHIAKLTGYPKKTAQLGKRNGLFLLLDPHPFRLNHTDENTAGAESGDQTFKVCIHTLAQYINFGPGSFGMSALKKMTGTESFKQLPEYQKKCLVHNREDCQTEKFLDQVQKECKCIPWALQTEQVMMNFLSIIVIIRQEIAFCGPEKETCVANQTLKDEECLVSCEGLYADIADDSLKQNTLKGYDSSRIFYIILIKIRAPYNGTRVDPRHQTNARSHL